jgi:N-methylhydantoinase B/oxoprolinase/acetone carboxylase alpha subunit
VSILSERRHTAPFGLEGGQAGRPGENLLQKSGGRTEKLGHRVGCRVDKGDTIIIKTPGGGGFGKDAGQGG